MVEQRERPVRVVVTPIEEVLRTGAVDRRGLRAVEVDVLVAFHEHGQLLVVGTLLGIGDAHHLALSGLVEHHVVLTRAGGILLRVRRVEFADGGTDALVRDRRLLDLPPGRDGAGVVIHQLNLRRALERHREVQVSGVAVGKVAGQQPTRRGSLACPAQEEVRQRCVDRRTG